MTHQIVITRRTDGGFRVLEMGLGASGMGETQREHELPQISAEMTTQYVGRLLADLVAVEKKL
jgi:hypothetical protein